MLSDSSTVDVTDNVTWSSSSNAAVVSSSGLVTGVGAGTAQITAKLDALTGTFGITVMPTPTPTPHKVEAKPLQYEVVGTNIELVSMKVWRSGSGEAEVFLPTGCVVVRNTDSAAGTVKIQFTFYVVSRSHAELVSQTFGDPIEKLAKELGDKYYGYASITLEPGQMGTAKCNITDTTMSDTQIIVWDYMLWDWEYTITEATKMV